MRKLTEEQLAKRVRVLAQLKANNGSVNKTAKQTGVTRATIRAWRDANETAAEKLQRQKAREVKEQTVIAEKVDEVVGLGLKTVEAMASELATSILGDLQNPKMRLYFRDKAWAFGVIFDKLQIMKGEPTAINKMVGSLSDEERAARAEKLLLTARHRRLNAGGQEMGIVDNERASGTGG